MKRSWQRAALRVTRVWVLALMGSLSAGVCFGQQATSMARYIPREGLLAYVEFDGLDQHEASWKKTSAYRMLNETTCGVMLEAVFQQTIDGGLRDAPGGKPTGAEVLGFIKALSKSGFAFGLHGKFGSDDLSGTLVVRQAARPAWTKALTTLAKTAGKTEQVTREDGRKVTLIRSNEAAALAWWFEKDELIIAFGKDEAMVDTVVDVITAKKPSATEHPLRLELAKPVDGFDPALVSFLDLSTLPATPPAMGLSGLKRIESRVGFQDEALVSIVRVVAPAPRTGLLALMDQPTFRVEDGLPIPEGVTDFMIASFSPLKLHDQVVALAKTLSPDAAPMIEKGHADVKALTGLDLREEILPRIGPRMVFYAEGDKLAIPVSPYHSMAQWFLHLPRMTMLVETKDQAGFSKMLDSLMTVANRQFDAVARDFGVVGKVGFRTLKGNAKGYELDLPLGVFPLPVGLNPTVRVGEGFAAISTSGESAAAAIKGQKRAAAPALARSLKGLPRDLNLLVTSDPTDYMPEVIANIPFFVQAIAMAGASDPTTPFKGVRLDIDRDQIPSPADLKKYLFPSAMGVAVDKDGLTMIGRDAFPSFSSASAAPVMVALLLPAVQSARTAAKRVQSTNNLKQIMLAYHNYHSAFDKFPPAAICDEEGKPLLSWRVAILPFIEQNALYEQFHLNEAWDSPHNKKLIEKMPAIYASPSVQPSTPFSTFYQTFVGKGALNESKSAKTTLADITDGTSNTVAVVEAGSAVVWTKPDDIAFDPDKPLPKLGGMGFPGGFNAAMCDGSVRFIRFTIDPDVLKAIVTRAGGEVINADDL